MKGKLKYLVFVVTLFLPSMAVAGDFMVQLGEIRTVFKGQKTVERELPYILVDLDIGKPAVGRGNDKVEVYSAILENRSVYSVVYTFAIDGELFSLIGECQTDVKQFSVTSLVLYKGKKRTQILVACCKKVSK